MKKIVWFALFDLFLFTLAANAQTLTPLVSEFNVRAGKTARGSFKIQNNSLTPVAFTIEADDFTLDRYGRHIQPLTSAEHVALSPSSGRLGPKEIREIEFKITCDTPRCEIVFRTAMVTGKTSQGLLVKVWL